MDFEYSEEQAMIRASVRDFAQKEIAPVARDNNRNEHFPVELVKRLGEMGLDLSGVTAGNSVRATVQNLIAQKRCKTHMDGV